MKVVYVLGGLGADKRVFHKIDFGAYDVHFIQWLTPYPNERIEDYAFRLTTQISRPNPILVGLSFGGIMAVEIAKHIPLEKIIIISSAKNKSEIPPYYRFAGKIGLTKIISPKVFIKANLLTNWFFSNRSLEDKKMLSAVVHDTDPVFLKWAIHAIAIWDNMTVHNNLHHIHGNADRILPYKFVSCNETLKGGAHLMIVNRAADMNVLLRKLLN